MPSDFFSRLPLPLSFWSRRRKLRAHILDTLTRARLRGAV